MRSSILFAVLVAFGLVASACPGLLGSDRISEEEADQIQDRVDAVAESLPTFADSRLVRLTHGPCAGALERLDSSACWVFIAQETDEPLISVLAFYESFLKFDGWIQLDIDSVVSRYFRKDGLYIQLFTAVPPLTCPDEHVDLEGGLACKRAWIGRNGGRYDISISPD